MPRPKAILILAVALPLAAADFSGARALAYTRRAVAFGPRPAGSAASRRLQAFIHTELRACRCEVQDDRFTAATPAGPVDMDNIIARFPGVSGRPVVAVTGHYDTKPLAGFLGANDGGSSTGLLLELARSLAGQPHASEVVLVWFDGEEAFRQWSQTDGLYGSRHLAERWAAEGLLPRIQALINVDMIGDRDLAVIDETNSAADLRRLVRQTAAELGWAAHFPGFDAAIEDDHLPFIERGVPAVDLIDFDYGPDNSYWHTTRDTMDKLSGKSLEIVGRVVLDLLRRIQARNVLQCMSLCHTSLT